jgi:hypothetical protein
MFIEPDEHIIIMDDSNRPMSLDDYKRLADCGIKTVYVHNVLNWHKILLTRLNEPNWCSVDERLETVLKSSLKLIIPFYSTLPAWVRGDRILKDGNESGLLRFPNYADAYMASLTDYLAMYAFTYCSKLRPEVQLICTMNRDGEFAWNSAVENPAVPCEVFAKFVIDRQKAFVLPFNEVWSAYHNFMPRYNNHVNMLNAAIQGTFPTTPHYSIQFTHFAYGDDPNLAATVLKYQNLYGIKYFGGSNFTAGLEQYLPKAIEHHTWGFITAPIHHFTNLMTVTDEMTTIISKTNKALQDEWQ